MKHITSKDNPTYKEIKKLLHNSSYRKEKNLTVAVGRKIVEDLATSHLSHIIKYVVLTNEKDSELFGDFHIVIIDRKLAKNIDEVFEDQGILAVVERNYASENTLPHHGPFVVLDGISDPINVGTIIRTAVGLGYKAILVSEQTGDPLSPKVIRYSAGYSLFIPIIRTSTKTIFSILKNRAIKVITTYLDNKPCISTWSSKLSDFAICLGNEGQGLSSIWKDYPDRINIKLKTEIIDSFNVAIAGGVLMYILKTGGEICG